MDNQERDPRISRDLDQEENGLDLNDLFAEREKERRQAELERAKREAMARAYSNTARMTLQGTNETKPPIEDFSDSMAMSQKRLSPDVKLTSVEPELTGYVSSAAAPQSFTPAHQEPQNRYAPASDNVPQTSYTSPAGAPIENEPQTAYTPAVNAPKTAAPASGQQNARDPYQTAFQDEDPFESKGRASERDVAGRGQAQDTAFTTYQKPYDYDYEEEDETDFVPPVSTRQGGKKSAAERIAEREARQKKEKQKKLIIALSICAVILALLVAAIVLILSEKNNEDKHSSIEPIHSSSQESSEEPVKTEKFSGSITSMSKSQGILLVYQSDGTKDGKEMSFTVKPGSDVSLAQFQLGDVVAVEYNPKEDNQIVKITYDPYVERIENITGVTLTSSQLAINQVVYKLDDHLVCMYNGQPYDKAYISKSTVFNVIILNDHLYTIEVTYAAGKITIENLSDYIGGTIRVMPASGEKTEMTITMDTMSVEVPEGSVSLTVIYENEEVYSGRIFVTIGAENTVHVPSRDVETGEVAFDSNIEGTFTITIDGKEYSSASVLPFEYGEYIGIARAEGYRDVEITFTVSQPYQMVEVKFEEKVARITIKTSSEGVEIWVDGVYEAEIVGSLTIELKPGYHVILAMKPGYEPLGETIEVDDDCSSQTLVFDGFVKIEEESSEESDSSDSDSSDSDSSDSDSSDSDSSDSDSSEDSDSSDSESSDPDSSESSEDTGSSEESSDSEQESSSEESSENSDDSGSEGQTDDTESEESTQEQGQ
ncbi:MAG: PEGA domain-containing protein [Clostridia bacterium]|nr:PEGA domain-containing protein [Clostridia bacterium]